MLTLRSAPAFGVSVTEMTAVPLPDAGSTAAHDWSACACQPHPASVRTSIAARPPAAARASDGPESENSHAAASCPISARWSPTVMAPRRVEGTPFADTRYAIEPSPCPVPPAVMAIQFASLAAVHAHSRATVTVREPAPPPAPKLEDELDSTG